MRRSHVLSLSAATAVLTLAPALSQAATVTVVGGSPFVATFTAAPKEVNDLVVRFADHALSVVDSGAPLTVAAGCVATGPNSATCPEPVPVVDVHLRDGDDAARVGVVQGARIWAGPGDDTVTADSNADATEVYGEAGDDEVTAGGEGGQIADGGRGNDVVHAGGFAGKGTGLGGPGQDILYFGTSLGGLAVLHGGSGDDTIVGQPSGYAGNVATGGDGDDIVAVHGAPPSTLPDGAYDLDGGPGADTLVGGPYADTIDAGDGRDFVDVLDGGTDTVVCGAGVDTVRFDAADSVHGDCENRLGPSQSESGIRPAPAYARPSSGQRSASSEVDVFASNPLQAIYRAGPGAANDVTFDFTTFSDAGATLNAGSGCDPMPDGSVRCAGAYMVDAYLRDADDRAHLVANGRARAWAGSGDDTVDADSTASSVAIYGESGDDDITAGGEYDQHGDGGPGDDTIRIRGYHGLATASGGSGQDLIELTVHGAFNAVRADLDGGTADDIIIARPPGRAGAAAGGAGDDIIAIHGDAPTYSPSGPYSLTGGSGKDTLVGGRFDDAIDAGDDRDYVDVLGGGADTVTCGAGTDVVRYDGDDTVAGDCEIRLPRS